MRLATVPLLALLLAGCATWDHLYLVEREVKCAPFKDPVVFLPDPPVEPYVELAHVEASGRVFIPVTWEELRFHLCLAALEVDAEAVIGLAQDHIDYSLGFTPLKVDWTNKKLTGIAIRYLDPGERKQDVVAPPAGETPAEEADAPAQAP